jgi:hypothetical protein
MLPSPPLLLLQLLLPQLPLWLQPLLLLLLHIPPPPSQLVQQPLPQPL